VVDDLYNLYNRRTSKSHGRFTTAEGSPTEGQVRDYVKKETDFLGLTSRMMDNLSREAAKKAASDGGHVFFAHFRREGRDYLLVTIVTDKVSAALTKALGMKDVEHLDLDGFRFAGRINLTAWAAGDERYLSFLKGKAATSEYFREFLGCDSAVEDRKDTKDLVTALKEFVVSEKMDDEDGDTFLQRAKEILEKAGKAKEEIDFDALANELAPKGPEKLAAYLAHADRRLNDGFVPNLAALRFLVRFKGATKMWTVEFAREAVTKDIVRFDKRKNTLTLFEVPPELVAQMREDGVIDG
jgi:nucleoid-associated protein